MVLSSGEPRPGEAVLVVLFVFERQARSDTFR